MYIARYIDDFGNRRVREFWANHDTHAYRKAIGIAKSREWKFISVGKA